MQVLRTFLVGLALAASGCSCDEAVVSRQCLVHADCDVGQHCSDGLCREGQPTCVKGVIEENCIRCAEHSDCPDGARCARSGLCVLPQCDADADCTNLCAEQGSTLEVCQADAESGWRQCVEFTCETDDQCQDAFLDIPAGLSAACVARGCRCRNPCGGTCLEGSVCCGSDDDERYGQCIDDPGPCGEEACGLGYEVAVASSGEWSMSHCRREGDDCRCDELPHLDPGITGIQSDLAILDGKAVVAAYNSSYGDILVGYGDQDGIDWQWIDGLPMADEESVTGGPTGPRFGISPEGADTGRFPTVAVASSGVIHIAYQNVDERSLIYGRSICGAGCDGGKVCTETGRCEAPTDDCDEACVPGMVCIAGACVEDARPNKFLLFELDGRGEVGFHNSITVDRNGMPHILSAAHRFDNQGIRSAEWRRYDGSVERPNGAQDFGFTDGSLTMDARLVTPLAGWPCEGGCPDGEVCIGEPGRCVVETDNCGEPCGDGLACFQGQCHGEAPNTPRGGEVVVNAFNQMVTDESGRVLAAWYDTRRNHPVLQEANRSVIDVDLQGGSFLSLAVRGASRHLAFIDNEQVVYAEVLPDGSVQQRMVVDDGARQLENRSEVHVLADTALDLAPDGTLTLYWQDATDHTLRFASKGPNDEAFGRASVLAGEVQPYEGSFGFSNRTARDDRAVFVSTFRFHLPAEEPDSGVVLFAR